tara:strand:- start:40 stop:177 length:138 start_codon:yes stop_codon:yes gene_type:complete
MVIANVLVLNDVVENVQQKENVLIVVLIFQQKDFGRKDFVQIDQF